jgi:hypothetical protein
MDSIVNLVSSWPILVQRAFSEHAIVVVFISVAALGIFVLLQQQWRPYSLPSNIAFVAGGWLIALSCVVFVMGAARKGWTVVEQAMPFAAKLSAYLYGICERHPMLALGIVGVGTLAFFLGRAWPLVLAWAPIRAVCTVVGIVLAIHVAGPIADLVDGEAVGSPFAAKGAPDKLTLVPVEQAVAQAIKSGDHRYMSMRQCVDDVSGYPVTEPGKEIASPWTIGVKPLGASCYESLGHDASVRMSKQNAYVVEYNRRMYEQNKSMARGLVSAR